MGGIPLARSTSGAGNVPIPPGGNSITRIMEGQENAAKGLLPDPQSLREAWDAPGMGLPGHLSHRPSFFRYLPPVYVTMWERVWMVPFTGTPSTTPRNIRSERTGADQVTVITNIQWFARDGGPAAPVLMDSGALMESVNFQLLGNGAPLYDVGIDVGPTIFPAGGRNYGSNLMFPAGSQGFDPVFSVYVRPDTLLAAQYTHLTTSGYAIDEVGVRIQGWKLPLTDFQRALSREGAGQLF